jgi:heme oxygenase (biliverdin-producing, ferredoxin)
VSIATGPAQTAVNVDISRGVAAALRTATMNEHRAAEERPFIVSLMGGDLSLADYVRYLAQFAWVYEALESHDAQPGESALFDPALARLSAIEHDLIALGIPNRRTEHPALPATTAYVAHLASIPAHDSVRWVAHHYTRYLGDLSGGQAIARLVARHYGATPEQLSFFDFASIDNLVAYKRAYRDSLDALQLTQKQREMLIGEVRRAYELNSAVFDDLAAE